MGHDFWTNLKLSSTFFDRLRSCTPSNGVYFERLGAK